MKDLLDILAYPKVNLALDVLEKRPDGYHEIQTVIAEVFDRPDSISIRPHPEKGMKIFCNDERVPLDDTNLVYKAIWILSQGLHHAPNLRITIDKQIPVAAGFGGGTSDAIAALKVVANLWGVRCCPAKNPLAKNHGINCLLRNVAQKVGSDALFFLNGNVAVATGRGEIIYDLPPLPSNLQLSIIDTGVAIATKDAYADLDLSSCAKQTAATRELIVAVRNGDASGIIKNLHNDFELRAYDAHPHLSKTRNDYLATHASSKVMLAGSGGGLFAATIQ